MFFPTEEHELAGVRVGGDLDFGHKLHWGALAISSSSTGEPVRSCATDARTLARVAW